VLVALCKLSYAKLASGVGSVPVGGESWTLMAALPTSWSDEAVKLSQRNIQLKRYATWQKLKIPGRCCYPFGISGFGAVVYLR